MSFINDTIAKGLASVKLLPVVSIQDGYAYTIGRAGVNASAAFDYAESKLSRDYGSTLLKRFFKEAGTGNRTYNDGEMKKIVAEVNYINRTAGVLGNSQVIKTESPSLSTTITRTSGGSRSNSGLEYAKWFKHQPLLGDFKLTSKVGNRAAPIPGASSNHAGVDLATPVGTRVYAVGDGVVELAGWQNNAVRKGPGSGYGMRIRIIHEGGYQSVYAHLSRIDVKAGQKVKAGNVIGLSGNTGNSSGPHLHFETRANNKIMDPMQYINALKQSSQIPSVNRQTLGESGMLNANLQDWLNRVMAMVQQKGNANVKSCIKTKADIQKFLELEGGYVNGKMQLTVVNSLGFMGPFQIGYPAWIEGPMHFSKLGKSSHASLKSATRNAMRGGPGDLNAMAPGIVRFWNKSWDYFVAEARNAGVGSLLTKVPRTVEMMYLLHNQGPKGTVNKLLLAKGNPIGSLESVKAQAVGNVVRRQYQSGIWA